METLNFNKVDLSFLEECFGNVLRELRLSRGLSQETMGFESGYHRTYISLLERGRKSPSLQTLFRLAKALNVEPSQIVKMTQSQITSRISAINKD